MANSSIISDIKDKIITEIINDKNFFYAIDSPDITDPENSDELINTHIFRYNQNPNTLKKVITFITVQVHTYKQNIFEYQDIWVRPKVEIWIISHESHMKVDNIPKIKADRNDYISQLLDDKFNGRNYLGSPGDPNTIHLLGKLDLAENTEAALEKDYLYRKMIFITRDLNTSMYESR